MRGGALRHRVSIMRKVVTGRNEFGEEVIGWELVKGLWADVRPIAGREFLELRMQQADVTHRIYIRGGVEVLPTMRVYFGDRVFEIESVTRQLERRVLTSLLCREAIER